MWLAAIATGSLLAAGRVPKQRPDWDSLPCANKTWDAWRTTFRAHQLTLESKHRATGERGDVFVSAAAAITIHGITTTTATPGALITPNILAHHAASEAAYQPAGESPYRRLTATSTRWTTPQQRATSPSISSQTPTRALPLPPPSSTTPSRNCCQTSNSGPPPRAPANSARDQTAPNHQTRTIKTLQAAVKNRWDVGGFCSTHGWGVGLHHTSGSCKKRGPGHVNTATRNKTAVS